MKINRPPNSGTGNVQMKFQIGNSKSKLNIDNLLETLRSRKNGCNFADTISKYSMSIFLSINDCILIQICLKFVLKGTVNNKPAPEPMVA